MTITNKNLEKQNRTEVDEFLDTDFKELPSIQAILHDYRKKTIIEELKEEDNVIADLFRGKTHSNILGDLKLKHPEHKDKFSKLMLRRFIERNDTITKDLTKANQDLSRRHFAAKIQIEEKLAGLIMFTENLVTKYDTQGDSQSTLKAIDIAVKSMMNYAKLAGFVDNQSNDDKPNKTVLQIVSEKHQSLAQTANKANFKIIDTYTDEDDNVDTVIEEDTQ